MRARLLLASIAILHAAPQAFDVASVKASPRPVGPDYNNQLEFSPSAFRARNATLRRLIAEAYGVQLRQVLGPAWLDRNEYEIDARAAAPASRDTLDLMLRSLIAARFHLEQHREAREMRVYELLVEPSGFKTPAAGPGLRFHGDLRRFADLIALQLTIPAADDPTQPVRAGGPEVPVLDKTGLTGTYDFTIALRPEPGVSAFSQVQRLLHEQFGLRLEARRAPVDFIVVDNASRVPTEN